MPTEKKAAREDAEYHKLGCMKHESITSSIG
jgi:hypothetical protein